MNQDVMLQQSVQSQMFFKGQGNAKGKKGLGRKGQITFTTLLSDHRGGVRIPYCGGDKSAMKSGRYAAAKRSRARCFKGQGNPKGTYD